MPNLTVSGNVDTLLSAADNAAIRSAIGVGQTDAPTFLAQTLTGQSLTGTQATSLVDMATTWLSTTGTPTAIKLNVIDTANVPVASKLMDLQVGGVSKAYVDKSGAIYGTGSAGGGTFKSSINPSGYYQVERVATGINFGGYPGQFMVPASSFIGWNTGEAIGSSVDVTLFRDAAGILAQRNGVNKQTLRIYNTYTSASIYERAVMDWNGPTPGNLQIGTEFLGSGSGMAARPIDFVTGGVVRMSIAAGGTVSVVGTLDVPTYSVAGVPFMSHIGSAISIGHSSLPLQMTGNRLAFNGTTSAFPAIKRNGTGIDIRLADDSAFAPVKGKLTTDTAYTATVVTPTGFLTLYDSTGTAYRVPCVV